MKISFLACFIICSLLFLVPSKVLAESSGVNQFVTIVNPVRISSYTLDPKASLAAEYQEVEKRKLPATWLLTYDVVSNEDVHSIIKGMDQFQELGIFLEVTPNLAKDANVIYNKTDSWHRANSVFLSGYTKEDRRKLIDAVFEKFKKSFGYYPVSVGAWWVDSFSLEYMKGKYNIISNLTVTDQFATDGYEVWGQYWSTPFYSSKLHSGIPGASMSDKLDIVTIQWAARDPLNGYGRGPASLFSTQDYFTKNLSNEYFQKLISLYTEARNNKFGQITVGLEGDFTSNAYGGVFARQLDIVKAMQDKKTISVNTMKDFANWYRTNFSELSPRQIIEADDILGGSSKSIWYQSPNLRIHITYDYKTHETRLLDLRFYYNNFQEPYYTSPNRDLNLSINIPSLIDSAADSEEQWLIKKEELDKTEIDGDDMFLKYKDGAWIKLSEGSLTFFGTINQVPKTILNAASVKINKKGNFISVSPEKSWIYSKEGLLFKDLTPEATNFLRQRKIMVVEIAVGISLLFFVLMALRRKSSKRFRFISVSLVLLIFLGGFFWFRLNSRIYFVSQAELDALNRMSKMPGDKVVVFDKICLQCSFHTKYAPAVFFNKRNYVKDVSGKKVVYNSSVFNAKTREEAKRELNKLKADYIYAVRFEDYKEVVPFSPGDLNLEEIYSNANATIWRIRKK